MSHWRYTIQKPAVRYLKRLPPKDRERIVEALDLLIEDPRSVDLKPLKGAPGLRLRVGSYRILMLVDKAEKLFVITAIGPRGDIYK